MPPALGYDLPDSHVAQCPRFPLFAAPPDDASACDGDVPAASSSNIAKASALFDGSSDDEPVAGPVDGASKPARVLPDQFAHAGPGEPAAARPIRPRAARPRVADAVFEAELSAALAASAALSCPGGREAAAAEARSEGATSSGSGFWRQAPPALLPAPTSSSPSSNGAAMVATPAWDAGAAPTAALPGPPDEQGRPGPGGSQLRRGLPPDREPGRGPRHVCRRLNNGLRC